jgi:hypothetical protein
LAEQSYKGLPQWKTSKCLKIILSWQAQSPAKSGHPSSLDQLPQDKWAQIVLYGSGWPTITLPTRNSEEPKLKIIDTHLTPLDLFVNSKLNKPKFAILGTCVAEHLVNVGLLNNCEVSHYLMETWVNTPLPSVDWNKFDGVIVHITLRHIMDMAAGIGLGDISYVFRKGHEFDALAQQCIRIMKQRIDEIVSGIGAARPIFFLSFLEPPQTTRGFFENNRKDNIYRLIRDMNDSMADHLHLLNGAYYVETNDIANYFGVANGYDGYYQHFTHAGFFGSHEAESFYKTIIQRIIGALTTLRTLDSVKLIVTDLDNTLWKGVVAEEDEIVPWQHHEGWPIGYIEALLECKRRGVLLAICSKNDEDKTKENFRKVWGEKISLEKKNTEKHYKVITP